MRWCFWTQMEDMGRMEARVLQVLDRLQATILSLSSLNLDGHIFLSSIVEADETQADRIERLLRKIYGMESVKAVPELPGGWDSAVAPAGGQEPRTSEGKTGSRT